MSEMKLIGKLIKRNPYEMTHSDSVSDFPIRIRSKKTRFFIDNEYLGWGYAKNLSKHATLAYIALARHANAKTQACFPSMETIVREVGICNKRYVSRGIKELEKYNIIFVDRPTKRGVNVYHLLDTERWKRLPGITPTATYKKPSVKTDKTEGQNKPITRVKFDPVNHRIKSYDEIEPKKINTEESEIHKAISFYKTFYKEEDIKLAINEIRSENNILTMKGMEIMLKQLTYKERIAPIKKPPW